MSPNVIQKVVVVIGGFQQNRNSAHGSYLLFRKLRTQFDGRNNVEVLFSAYDDDFQEVANRIANLCGFATSTTIIVAAYSWGAGRGVPLLCGALDRHGYIVSKLVLCDPVLHGPWYYMLWLLVARRFYTFDIPLNVRKAWVFWQNRSRPAGYPVERASEHFTSIIKRTQLDAAHSEMDNSAAYHKLVLEVAA